MKKPYDPLITVYKTGEAGATVGGTGIVIGFLMLLIRSRSPELPWSEDQDLVLVGALTGALSGIIRGVQNWWKNKGVV